MVKRAVGQEGIVISRAGTVRHSAFRSEHGANVLLKMTVNGMSTPASEIK
jgi:hypothetical protein